MALLLRNQTVGVAPPSIRKVVPVMKSLSGLAIKQTATAMSLGSPNRATVCWRTFFSAKSRPTCGSSLPNWLASVLNQGSTPGVDQARHNAVGGHSRSRQRFGQTQVRLFSAAFAAPYGPNWA